MPKPFANRSAVAAALAAVLAAGHASVAQAQTLCGPRQQIVDLLNRRHGEAPVSIGLAANGSALEVFSSRDGQSWSLVMTAPSGRSCLIATGESWISVTPVAGEVS